MTSIDRYIIRTTFGAFTLVLVSLTAVIWVTHALREIDLMTSQGQTILVFIGITSLLIPLLVLVIAPIAFVLSVAYTLNKLSADSEIIVLNAAGMSPWQLFRPFLFVAVCVSIGVAAISSYVAPKGLRELRNWATQVRADFVTNLVQPGRFTTIERGLTFHLRERRSDGRLLGIFVDDRRQPTERSTFLAEQGEIVETDVGSLLVLEVGSIQRHEAGKLDPTIVQFERYAFDLSRFTGGPMVLKYSPRERYLWELAAPDMSDETVVQQAGQFRSEFHDRIVAPLYPLVFVTIAFAALGAPRTTRQSRGMLVLLGLIGVGLVRFVGFGAVVAGSKNPLAFIALYASIFAAIGIGLYLISRGSTVEPPRFLVNAISRVERLVQRTAPT